MEILKTHQVGSRQGSDTGMDTPRPYEENCIWGGGTWIKTIFQAAKYSEGAKSVCHKSGEAMCLPAPQFPRQYSVYSFRGGQVIYTLVVTSLS